MADARGQSQRTHQTGSSRIRWERAVNCPYCDLPRSRQECIDENMARGVLPACACGPRDDASKAVKRRFRKWLASEALLHAPSHQADNPRKD